jgi:NADH-quinone oxidoreductase subunit L
MVAAGVYLHIRLFDFFPPSYLICLTVVGLTTALASGIAALISVDFKQILAFSTLSQLGLLFLALGLGSPEAAWFHLFTHAFFKAGLFLVAGFWIHQAEHTLHRHTQDIRELGASLRSMGVVGGVFLLCVAALVGLPFSAGYYSKELILELSLRHPTAGGFTLFTSSLTGAYAARLVCWLLLAPNPKLNYFRNTPPSTIPLLFLGLCSLGWSGFWDHGAAVLGLALPNGQAVHAYVSTQTFLLGLGGMLLGGGAGWVLYSRECNGLHTARVHPFLTEPLGLSIIYGRLGKPIIQRATMVAEWGDRKIIDAAVDRSARLVAGDAAGTSFSGLAPVLAQADSDAIDAVPAIIARLPWWVGRVFRRAHVGNIQYYLLLSSGLVSVLVLILYLIS